MPLISVEITRTHTEMNKSGSNKQLNIQTAISTDRKNIHIHIQPDIQTATQYTQLDRCTAKQPKR